jgi:hypothetical protein
LAGYPHPSLSVAEKEISGGSDKKKLLNQHRTLRLLFAQA